MKQSCIRKIARAKPCAPRVRFPHKSAMGTALHNHSGTLKQHFSLRSQCGKAETHVVRAAVTNCLCCPVRRPNDWVSGENWGPLGGGGGVLHGQQVPRGVCQSALVWLFRRQMSTWSVHRRWPSVFWLRGGGAVGKGGGRWRRGRLPALVGWRVASLGAQWSVLID